MPVRHTNVQLEPRCVSISDILSKFLGIGDREMVQWEGLLLCTELTRAQSLVSHSVSLVLPVLIMSSEAGITPENGWLWPKNEKNNSVLGEQAWTEALTPSDLIHCPVEFIAMDNEHTREYGSRQWQLGKVSVDRWRERKTNCGGNFILLSFEHAPHSSLTWVFDASNTLVPSTYS